MIPRVVGNVGTRIGKAVVGITAALISFGLFAASASAGYSVDRSFGSGGQVSARLGPAGNAAPESSQALERDRSGRLVLGAANGEEWQVRRYLRGGRLDPSFGDGGKVAIDEWGRYPWTGETALTQVAIRPNGRILLVGFLAGTTKVMMQQLMPDGSPDTSFGEKNGSAVWGYDNGAVAVALRSNGRFVASGFSTRGPTRVNGVLYGFDRKGNGDKSFANEGTRIILGSKTRSSYLLDVEVLPDGKILAGSTYKGRYMVIRLKPNGQFDPSFGRGGMTVVEVGRKGCRCALGRAIDVDAQGRVLLAGYLVPRDPEKPEHSATIRLTRDGKLDRSFGRNGIVRLVRGPSTRLVDIAVDPRGGIWVTGSTGHRRGDRHMITARYLPNGRLDRRFGRQGRLVGGPGKASAGWRVLAAGRAVYLSGRWERQGQENVLLRKFTLRR